MNEWVTMEDTQICAVIGVRLKIERLRNNLSQADLSAMIGVSLRTYKRFESTGMGQIGTFVAVLRALNRLQALEVLLPRPTIVERESLVAKVGRLRKRARKG